MDREPGSQIVAEAMPVLCVSLNGSIIERLLVKFGKLNVVYQGEPKML